MVEAEEAEVELPEGRVAFSATKLLQVAGEVAGAPEDVEGLEEVVGVDLAEAVVDTETILKSIFPMSCV